MGHVVLYVFGRHIHLGKDVGVVAIECALKVDGTCRVVFVNPLLHVGEVLGVGSLVAHRPIYNRRVVVLIDNVVLVALHYRQSKLRFGRLGVLFVVESVAFLVGFGTNVDAIFIAQIIPVRV